MPLYFSFHGVASALRLTAPKYQEIASALRNAGFATSQCHCDPSGAEDQRAGEVVFDVFRAYFRKFQLAEKQEWLEKLPEGFAKQYLSQPATREVTIGSGVHCSTISRWCPELKKSTPSRDSPVIPKPTGDRRREEV